MGSDFTQLCSKSNLLRAWRWINSNPEYRYKNHFRDLYSAYNISLDDNIADLSQRLKDNSYEPQKPCLMLFPKSSSTMRPMTLLSIEDQIVYQAFINIVANYHLKKTGKRYGKTVFGHLYAGKQSVWFYRKWQSTYNQYRKTIKQAYLDGKSYIASFDLTACYDSIDHKVIEYFLSSYGIQKEFIDELTRCLVRWSTNSNILHGHGIPQGPLGSGLLAETVLTYFDITYERSKMKNVVTYARYVDDIKLLSKDEHTLRRMLTRLDFACKQIALFPQTKKIDIHKIEDIDFETKSISVPILEFSNNTSINQVALRKRIYGLSKNNHIQYTTDFKRCLSKAQGNAELSKRLLNLLNYHPELFENVCLYFDTYQRNISSKIVDQLINELDKPEVYQIINAQLLMAFRNHVSISDEAKLTSFAQKRWNASKKITLVPIYRMALLSYLINNNRLSFTALKEIVEVEQDWWVLKNILKYINLEYLGEPSYLLLMNSLLRHESKDVSLAAAQEIIRNDLRLSPPFKDINYLAQKPLKYAGIIYRATSRPSVIHDRIQKICNKRIALFNWKTFFNKNHDAAENKIIHAYAYSRTDASAFVNIMDVFNDFVLDSLYHHNSSLGIYTLGKIGSVLDSKRLKNEYPKLQVFCQEIHQKRLECDLSHPIIKSTSKHTKRIEYKYIFTVRKAMYEAYTELITKGSI